MANSAKMKIRYISENEAQVTKVFEKNAAIFGTDEFKLWREYKAQFPNAKMVTKSIKKSEKKKTRRNMKFANMELFMATQKNSAELLEEFETVKKRSKVQTCPYQYVLEWFEEKFEGYDDLGQFLAEKEAERASKEVVALSA